jgi:hypothetical protein
VSTHSKLTVRTWRDGRRVGIPSQVAASHVPVRGQRLLLRPLAIGDADTLLAYRSREDVCRYVPFKPMSRNDIIERIAGQWGAHGTHR